MKIPEFKSEEEENEYFKKVIEERKNSPSVKKTFGELLIESAKEAVEIKQGKRKAARITIMEKPDKK